MFFGKVEWGGGSYKRDASTELQVDEYHCYLSAKNPPIDFNELKARV